MSSQNEIDILHNYRLSILCASHKYGKEDDYLKLKYETVLHPDKDQRQKVYVEGTTTKVPRRKFVPFDLPQYSGLTAVMNIRAKDGHARPLLGRSRKPEL